MWNSIKAWLAGDLAEEMTSLRFEFNAPGGNTVAVLLILAVVLGTIFLYWPLIAKLGRGQRAFVVALRTLVLAIALFMLLDPCIIGDRIEPGTHYIAVLFDDSKSMKIVGEDGLSRADRMTAAYEAATEDFEDELRKRYRLARYRFGAQSERIRHLDDLKFEERETNLTGAIGETLRSLQGVNVSGVVIFSDGIQQAEAAGISLDEIAAEGVPIFAVGADSESDWRDLEIGDLTVARTEFDRSPVVMTVPVRAIDLAGEEAIVEVILDGRVVQSERFEATSADHEREIRMEFVPEEEGWLEFEVRVRLASTGDAGRSGVVREIAVPGKDGVVENNSRRFLIDNRQKEFRILWFGGRPTWEYKFLNRALWNDEQLKLTGLIRVAPEQKQFVFRGRESGLGGLSNPLFAGFGGDREFLPRYDESTFVRLQVGERSELEGGYPLHPAELFKYHLVIWNEIEYEFFDPRQIELTRDFVNKRGGSFLMMGGQMAFERAGFRNTVLENMLPVVFDIKGEGTPYGIDSSLLEQFSVEPTVDGLLSGTFSLGTSMDESRRIWRSMLQLTGLNLFLYARPGATVLAQATADFLAPNRPAPIYVWQRYGEGRTAVLATGATWQWQMSEDLEDERHERLWRQIIRGLVNEASEPVYLRDKQDAYTLGNPVDLEFIVRDEVFDEREGLRVTVTMTSPSGKETSLAVDESLEETGFYAAALTPEEEGMYAITLEAIDDKDVVVARIEDEAILAQPDGREFARPQYDPGFLKRLADRSGGKFYTLDQIADIAADIPFLAEEDTEAERVHLWRWPPFFFLVLTMLAIEWILRRKKGYA